MVTVLLATSLALADAVAEEDPCLGKSCPPGHEEIGCYDDSAECLALEKRGYVQLCRGFYSQDKYCGDPAVVTATPPASPAAAVAPPETATCGCRTSAWSPAAGLALLVLATIRRRTA